MTDTNIGFSVAGMFALSSNFSLILEVHCHCSYSYSVLIFQNLSFQGNIFRIIAFTQRSYCIRVAHRTSQLLGRLTSVFSSLQLVPGVTRPLHQKLSERRKRANKDTKKCNHFLIKDFSFLRLYFYFMFSTNHDRRTETP